MKKITLLIVAIIFIATTAPRTFAATSASGTTNIGVNLPQFITLFYYSGITIDYASPTNIENLVSKGNNSFDASLDGGDASGTGSLANIAPSAILGETKTTLPNVWAVKGLSYKGTAKVTIILGQKELALGTSKVRIDDITIQGTKTREVTVPLSMKTVTPGGIVLNMNFSETTRSGLHTGGSITIKAETI